MIFKCGDANFKYAWLDLIAQDPVHPSINPYTRVTGSRAIFIYGDGNDPQYIISAKFGEEPAKRVIAGGVNDILADENSSQSTKKCVSFYSIFRTNFGKKGHGGQVLKDLVDFLKLRGTEDFYTLSPIPFLRKNLLDMGINELPSEETIREYLETKSGPVERFHLNNGASIASINFDADESELRMDESWGVMINYKY